MRGCRGDPAELERKVWAAIRKNRAAETRVVEEPAPPPDRTAELEAEAKRLLDLAKRLREHADALEEQARKMLDEARKAE